jgi:hypothetical protein
MDGEEGRGLGLRRGGSRTHPGRDTAPAPSATSSRPVLRLRRTPSAVAVLKTVSVLLLAAASCATPPDPQAPAPGVAPPAEDDGDWIRSVYPFEVLDAEGRPYDHPFLGGFTAPRPQFVDINGDGALDLFVHERGNELMYLENVGSPGAPEFRWRTDRWKDLEVGEWTRFVDLTGNGLMDLLAEERFSYIRVYRNEGTPQEPRMVLVPDSLRDVEGRAIFADRQNVPAFHDIDGNGLLDLFLGRIEGTVSRYQAVEPEGGEEGVLPRFRLLADRFEGIEIIGTLVRPTSLHGANSMFFADANGNGLKDLYWGDFFEAGLLFLENRGTPGRPSIHNVPVPVQADGEPIATSGFNAPVLVDLFDQGSPDLFIGVLGGAYNPNQTAADNFHHYRNDGEGNFELVTTRFLYGIDVGEESVPALGDINGSGTLDLLVGSKAEPGVATTGRVYWFENVGEAGAPRFRLREVLELTGGHNHAPAVAHLWADDELPGLVLGTFRGEIHFFRNVGTAGEPGFELQEAMSLELPRGSHSAPALADMTGNGLLDLVVGRSNGELAFYRNVGTPAEPAFELVTDRWLELRVGRRSHPAFVDLDGDGLLDLVVGQEGGGVVAFRNTGTEAEPAFEEDPDFQLPLYPYSAPAFGDLTGNGRDEVVAGGASGGVLYFERR